MTAKLTRAQLDALAYVEVTHMRPKGIHSNTRSALYLHSHWDKSLDILRAEVVNDGSMSLIVHHPLVRWVRKFEKLGLKVDAERDRNGRQKRGTDVEVSGFLRDGIHVQLHVYRCKSECAFSGTVDGKWFSSHPSTAKTVMPHAQFELLAAHNDIRAMPVTFEQARKNAILAHLKTKGFTDPSDKVFYHEYVDADEMLNFGTYKEVSDAIYALAKEGMVRVPLLNRLSARYVEQPA